MLPFDPMVITSLVAVAAMGAYFVVTRLTEQREKQRKMATAISDLLLARELESRQRLEDRKRWLRTIKAVQEVTRVLQLMNNEQHPTSGELEIISRKGNLFHVEHIPHYFNVGDFLVSGDKQFEIVLIDRESNELGLMWRDQS